MAQYEITKERASQIAGGLAGKYSKFALPVDLSLYAPPELLTQLKQQKLLDYATGELRRRLVMLNERGNGITSLTDLVLDLHGALVAKLNKGHPGK